VDTVSLVALTGIDLFAMLGAVLWYALRVGAALQVLPVVGGHGIPGRARLVITLALSASMAMVLPAPPPMGVDAATVLGVVREFALGVAIGMMLRLAFEAGRLAGELVSVGMGLSFATMADPLSGTSSPVLAQWFYLAFALLFFAVDGHLALVNLLADSYGGVAVGAAPPDVHGLLAAVPAFFGACLRAGVLLALPVMMALLSVNLAFGVLARAAAQLNPIAVGLPVSLLAGLTLLMLLMPRIEPAVRRLFEDAFTAARALTG
jgi:flagellar biosynthetic protein FliR